jgi:hypothetical protein
MHMSGLKNQETVKFLSGPYSAEWAIDCFLYFPPSFFLNTAINFLSYSDLCFFPSLSPLVLSAAKKARQAVARTLQAGGLLQPDEAGQTPDRLSEEYSENISCAGR